MKNEELKPCPFCGHEAAYYQSGGSSSDYEVGCFNGECPVEPHAWAESEEEAIVKWNTRLPILYMIEKGVQGVVLKKKSGYEHG